MRVRTFVLVGVGAAGLFLGVGLSRSARADEDDEVRAEVTKAIREGRRDDARDRLDLSLRAASQANKPLRLGRLELFRAELDAERPTTATVDSARRALLHLATAPDAVYAAVRYHVSGAQVALASGRLGAAALHVQEARAALAKVPVSPIGTDAVQALGQAVTRTVELLGKPDPRRDEVRLGDAERGLMERLRKVVDERAEDVPPGTMAALVAYVSKKPLAVEGQGDEPIAPKSKPSFEGLRAKLDRSLADAEAVSIAQADQRKDGRAAAMARSRHADTLARMGKRDEAIKVRREALAYLREHGTIEEILIEDGWIAERFDRDKKAQAGARRDTVVDLERAASRLAGPARTALRSKHRAEYVALVEAVAALGPKGSVAEPLEAVEWLRDRSVSDDAALLGDGAKWQRAGAAAAELRRALESVAREDWKRAGGEETAGEEISPQQKVLQRVSDTLARGDTSLAPAPLDLAALQARLGGRSLLVYARMDADRIAIAAVPARGAAKLSIVKLAAGDENALVTGLREGLRAGEDGWREPARNLYDALVGPVESAITPAGLLLAADGALADVPFAALVDKKGKFLVERTALERVLSLASLSRTVPDALKDAPILLVSASRFADPSVPALASADRVISSVRATLEAAGRKTRAAAAAIAGDKLAADAGPFDVVHLATRARLDPRTPLLGALALPTSSLHAFALGAGAIRANLVVVDAPTDGTPQLSPEAEGRALSGLAAGVLAGPAPSAIIGAPFEGGPAEAALLSRFYERYAGGESKAAALAGAQRDMAQIKLEQPLLHQAGSSDPVTDGPRFAHPRFWALFSLWGEP